MGGLLMISSSFSRFFTCLRFVRSWMSFSAGLCNPLFVVSFLVKHLVPVPEYSRFHDIDGHIGRLQDESSTWKDAAKKTNNARCMSQNLGLSWDSHSLKWKIAWYMKCKGMPSSAKTAPKDLAVGIYPLEILRLRRQIAKRKAELERADASQLWGR